MQIEQFINSLNNISDASIIKLLSDYIFPNIEKIKNFSTTQAYKKGDILYRYDEVNKKHKFFTLSKDIAPGEITNPDDSEICKPTTPSGGKATIKANVFSIAVESNHQKEFLIPSTIEFDPEVDGIMISHSVTGPLTSDSFTCVKNPTGGSSITITSDVYANEYLNIQIIR